ncbi:serine/threonine-protein kinase [Carbonactinospora thermoautotrophica]|uniref:serine/threonine-protein kinase n=1 Tax=Carbonactinospora thermoautotrophica TaxID=1469144 RepID=UPI003DA87D95
MSALETCVRYGMLVAEHQFDLGEIRDMRLQLGREWILSERIGRGGFGQVYAAKSADHESAVAKLVPKEPGAERELLFVDLSGVRNVVPIIDSGETEDSWVLIMPRAEKSLRQHLHEAGGSLDTPEAVAILRDIATALVDLDGKVVHRDLKPENVLLLDGHWCLADFGISRYAEATTAPYTQKHALSPPYAAPERWRNERATSATDVYSLGVIAYELLSGSLPFAGPGLDDFREQHLHRDPPYLNGVSAALETLVTECLYKAPGARPSPANLLARLARIAESTPSAGLAKLQEVNCAEAVRRGESARRESEARSESERRAALFDAATKGLSRIAGSLKQAITDAAPAATVWPGPHGGWIIRLNQAELGFVPPVATAPNPWGSWDPPAFDVIAHAALSIKIPIDRHGYEGRSHSLWYCDAQEAGRYQWFETAFMISPLIPKRGRQNPFALNPGIETAKAVWNGLAEFQVAWPFTPVRVSELDQFIDRWAGWFADAAQGQLHHPISMPERSPEGSWRRT